MMSLIYWIYWFGMILIGANGALLYTLFKLMHQIEESHVRNHKRMMELLNQYYELKNKTRGE